MTHTKQRLFGQDAHRMVQINEATASITLYIEEYTGKYNENVVLNIQAITDFSFPTRKDVINNRK